MKTVFILMLILFTSTLSSNELAWVDEQVKAIKPPRSGMTSRGLSIIKNPFIFLAKNRGADSGKKGARKSSPSKKSKSATSSGIKNIIEKRRSLILTVIMNTSAMINGKWYKIGDKLNGYTISKIDSSSVLLTKKSKKLLLSTNSKNLNLNFNNK